MKPLFSKSEKEVYHPGDPRRKAFEDKLRSMGRNLEELEGKTIVVDNGGVVKVSLQTSNVVNLRSILFVNDDKICQRSSTPTTSSTSPPSTISPSPTLTTSLQQILT